jgi:glutamate formiminotransferase / formiminotetrahydrofolate cyclodeaminase
LENRLQESAAQQEAPEQTREASFLDALSAGTATPGGGSGSAHAGAAGAALVAMVARLTVGKKKYAGVEARMWEIIERADALRAELTAAVQEDSAAFEAYIAAVRLPKDTEHQQADRAAAMEKATLETIRVPLKVTSMALEVLRLAAEAASTGNINAISDAASGAALARAALTGSSLNVRINCPNLQDQSAAQGFLQEVRQVQAEARKVEEELQKTLEERGNLPQ